MFSSTFSLINAEYDLSSKYNRTNIIIYCIRIVRKRFSTLLKPVYNAYTYTTDISYYRRTRRYV